LSSRSKLKFKYKPLPSQEPVFLDDTTETIMHSAGLGCLSSNSEITTLSGRKKIGEIHRPFFVLSHYKSEVVWALSTAPFYKGTDNLYRVKTQLGEFAAHELHHSFLEDGKCQSVRDLHSSIDQNSFPLLLSSLGNGQKAPFLSALRLIDTLPGSQNDYQSYIRFYGEQLRSALALYQDDLQLLFGALELVHGSYFSLSDQVRKMEQERIHLNQLFSQKQNLDYTRLRVVLEAVLEYQDFFSTSLGHILQFHQVSKQALEILKHHLSAFEEVQCSSNSFLSSCKISSVNKESLPKPYYDCHVFFSNSYFSDGSYHHNSGKSYNLCMKLIKLSRLNKGHAGGLLCPSYAMFKKDIYPTFMDIFDKSRISKGKYWSYNSQDKTYKFAWNDKPLYIFTAENEIAGPNLGYGGINEFSLCQWERVNQFLRRIRTDSPYKQKILAGTPEDRHGWLMDYVNMMNEQASKDPSKFKIVFGDTTENTYIDQDYAATLEYMLDKKALQVFKEGRIVKISGDLFYYSFDRTKHCGDFKRIPGQTVYANLDFNVGRMTCTFAHKLSTRVRFFDEFELTGNSDTPQAALEILRRYGKDVIITIDASGKNRKTSGYSDYQLLMQAGFSQNQIRFKSVNPRFRERQLLVNGKFDKGEIEIDSSLKVLIKDLEQVEQSRLTFEKIKDKEGKLTHSSDTLDYFLDYEFTLYINRTSSTIQL
jgi:hypothetical protein